MNAFKTLSAATLLAVTGLTFAVAADDFPAVPPTPAPVYDLISAQPFVLQEAMSSGWIKGTRQVSAGYIVVLSVNPDLVHPRNSLMPVLYAGSTTGEPVNFGAESGKVVAILPSTVNEDGTVALDLTQTPIWYGTPALPEQVDAAKVTGEQALAKRAGIKPFSAAKVAQALKAGGEQITLANHKALMPVLGRLIMQYSPQEKPQADQLLGNLPQAPGTTAGPK